MFARILQEIENAMLSVTEYYLKTATSNNGKKCNRKNDQAKFCRAAVPVVRCAHSGRTAVLLHCIVIQDIIIAFITDNRPMQPDEYHYYYMAVQLEINDKNNNNTNDISNIN